MYLSQYAHLFFVSFTDWSYAGVFWWNLLQQKLHVLTLKRSVYRINFISSFHHFSLTLQYNTISCMSFGEAVLFSLPFWRTGSIVSLEMVNFLRKRLHAVKMSCLVLFPVNSQIFFVGNLATRQTEISAWKSSATDSSVLRPDLAI